MPENTEGKEQFDLLIKQVEDGIYDGDGPADVAPIHQEKHGEEERFCQD